MKKIFNKYFIYLIIFILICIIVFLPFILNGRSLIMEADASRQHFIIFCDYMSWLKDILFNGSTINTFSWNIGLGSDILSQYSYYIIGDLFSYFGLFFSTNVYPVVYSILIIIRIFCIGLSMLFYCSYKKYSNYKSIISAIIYAFSAFALFGVVRHPFFANAAILFPLFLIGIEKLIKENKLIYLIFISFLILLSNFYFCYMIVILGFIYALFLFFFENNDKSYKNFFKKIMLAALCFFVAFCLASFVLIPTIFTYLDMNTVNRNVSMLIYPISYYKNLLFSFVSTNSVIWVTIGVSPLCILLIPNLLKNNKDNKVEICMLIFMSIMLLLPLFGSLMNGFSFPSNRWTFGYIFFLSLIVTKSLNDNLIYKEIDLKKMFLIFIIFSQLLYLVNGLNLEFIIIFSIMFFMMLVFLFQLKFKTKILSKVILFIIILFGICFNGLYLYSNLGKGYGNEFLKYNDFDFVYKDLSGEMIYLNRVIDEIKSVDDSFYRTFRSPHYYQNLSILYNYNSGSSYLSLLNGTTSILSDDLNNVQREASNNIKSFDNRTIATNILGSKYYIVNKNNIKKVPFGYEKYLEFDYTDIQVYKNKYYLSPIIFYDSYILESEYDRYSSLEKESSLVKTVAIPDNKKLYSNIKKDKFYNNKISEVDCSIFNVDFNDTKYLYSKSDKTIRIVCDGVENSEIYLELDNLEMYRALNNNFEYNVTVNRRGYYNNKKIENKLLSAYYVDYDSILFNMGYEKNIDDFDIDINLSSEGDYSFDDIKVYSVSMDDYEKDINKLRESSFDIEEYDDGLIKGSIKVNVDGILQLSTDYSKGWRVFVDGEEVETFIVNKSFLGFEIAKGNHEIIFKYKTPYLNLANFVFIFGVLVLSYIMLFYDRCNCMNKLLILIKGNLKVILQKLRRIGYILFYTYFRMTNKVIDNKILFLSDSRKDLSGNFEFVYNEIMKGKNKYEVTMLLKNKLSTKKTLKEKINLCKEIALSKYIFLDDFYPIIYALKLRKETELIQLWHAMGAFKTVGYSRTGKPGGPESKSLTHRGYTGAIVSSEKIRKNYAEAFAMDFEKVHALGVPRTDIFFDKKYEENAKKKIYKKYPVLKNKKVILFAPTFRGNGQKTAYYDFNWLDFRKFKDSLGKNYICIIKLHPFINNKPDYNFENDDFYLDLTSDREINDLLFVTDILVTDYSSVIFEYSFFERPVVFFVPDLDDYRNSRDFYYPLENYTYGDIAKDEDELIKCIKKEKVNKKKLKEFKDYFCSSCDGKSTKKVVDYFVRNKNN